MLVVIVVKLAFFHHTPLIISSFYFSFFAMGFAIRHFATFRKTVITVTIRQNAMEKLLVSWSA